MLLEEIRALFGQSRGTYGSPRIHRALTARCHRISRRRVERLMREAGLRARVVRIYRANPGLHRFFAQHPNRLWEVEATKPDKVWVGDVTYLRVASRWRYFAAVMDQCSRKILSWRLRRVRDARLTRASLDAAYRRRRPKRGTIFHSDRGSEYSAATLRDRVTTLGLVQSMGRAGTPADNAHMESFFHTLKAELVHGRRFQSDAELRENLRRYVHYYNHHRLHSALEYRSPVDFERRARK